LNPVDSEKIEMKFIPYLADLFSDLSIRSTSSIEVAPARNYLGKNKKRGLTIDRNTFLEFAGLPGIINDRLHFLLSA